MEQMVMNEAKQEYYGCEFECDREGSLNSAYPMQITMDVQRPKDVKGTHCILWFDTKEEADRYYESVLDCGYVFMPIRGKK